MPRHPTLPLLSIAIVLATLVAAPVASAREQDGSGGKGARAGQAATASLPNGATSITEVYGDWTINCAVADNRKTCVLGQEQGNSQTGQRLFGVELQPPANGQTEGVLLLPLGLLLEDGIKLKIDDQNLGEGARFSSCLPAGCIVPVSFPTVATDAMKNGQKLIVTANQEGAAEPPTFTISLNGFTAALGRATELSK